MKAPKNLPISEEGRDPKTGLTKKELGIYKKAHDASYISGNGHLLYDGSPYFSPRNGRLHYGFSPESKKKLEKALKVIGEAMERLPKDSDAYKDLENRYKMLDGLHDI